MTWNKEGVPHRGWRCIDVEDLADLVDGTEEIPYEQCEMCGNERIRFVHLMQHPDYPHKLRVGCVCAEKMSDDYVNPRKAEDTLRKRASRRKNFNNKEWRFNPEKQTYSKKYKGEYITIKKSRYGNFGIYFANKSFWNHNGKKSILLKVLNGQLLRYLKNCIPHRQNENTNTGFPGGILMGTTNKICPHCGRKMKQQFIDLQHCKCGMSWKKDLGFFERTPNMVFCLQRNMINGKVKRCPVIRFKEH